MRVLMVTCEWPTAEYPYTSPFVVRQVAFLRRAGIEVEVFAFRGAKNPLNYLRAWCQIRKRLRRESYDLVHAQWGQSAITVLPTRLPLVVTFRGGEGEGIVGSNGKYTLLGVILRAVSSLVARRADELVVVSSHMKGYLPGRRVHVVPSGLDFSTIPLVPTDVARTQLGLPAGKRLVLFVGNPEEARKRHALARAVVSRLDPRLEAELVTAWEITHDQIPLYMCACDALLFTSMFEGSPNVVKEALACNLPVVSVEVGDVRERLEGVDGCVVCPGADPDQLAAALTTILQRGRLVDGRNSVQSLAEEVLTGRIVEIYRLAAAKSGRQTGRAPAGPWHKDTGNELP